MKSFFTLLVLTILSAPFCLVVGAAEKKIVLTPSAPYDRFIIYESLILFWVGIVGLIVIIRMKLKETERTQRMGLNKEEKDAPLLE